MLKVIT